MQFPKGGEKNAQRLEMIWKGRATSNPQTLWELAI